MYTKINTIMTYNFLLDRRATKNIEKTATTKYQNKN